MLTKKSIVLCAAIVSILVCITLALYSPAKPTNASQDVAKQTIFFDGETWEYRGVPLVHGDVSRLGMEASGYMRSDPDVRVIEFTNPNLAIEGVYDRILQRQIRSGNTWVSAGRGEHWLSDGTHEIINE
jgi:hypothetical protein